MQTQNTGGGRRGGRRGGGRGWEEQGEQGYDPPVEVRLVAVAAEAAERIHSEPGAEGEAALIRPPGDRRQRYGLEEDRITLSQ